MLPVVFDTNIYGNLVEEPDAEEMEIRIREEKELILMENEATPVHIVDKWVSAIFNDLGLNHSSSPSHFSASIAAMQPEPAAVIACLNLLSCTSPAAKTPEILVCE